MTLNKLLKLCGVSSSLLLVAAFISYRAGALGRLTESSVEIAPLDVTGGESSHTPGVVTEGAFSLTPAPGQILYGSRDDPVFIDSQPISPEEIERERMGIAELQRAWSKIRGIRKGDVIHSSKFGTVFVAPDTPVQAVSEPPPNSREQPPVLMSGSKSPMAILPGVPVVNAESVEQQPESE